MENAGASDDASQAAASLAAPGAKAAVVKGPARAHRADPQRAVPPRAAHRQIDKPEALGALDKEWGYGVHEWEDALDDFYDEHEYVNTTPRRVRPSCSCSTRSTRTIERGLARAPDHRRLRRRPRLGHPPAPSTWTRRNPAAKSSSSTTPSPTTDAAGPPPAGAGAKRLGVVCPVSNLSMPCCRV